MHVFLWKGSLTGVAIAATIENKTKQNIVQWGKKINKMRTCTSWTIYTVTQIKINMLIQGELKNDLLEHSKQML